MRYAFISTFDRTDYASTVRSTPTYVSPTPDQVEDLIAQACAARSRYMRSLFFRAIGAVTELFRASTGRHQPR
ncbi:hypothetical protein [Minwuia sp.]|uniref:hypothetical protein n=1 Tax=Minwuia sp. TaxID=2493630 RepID=UPI003A903380